MVVGPANIVWLRGIYWRSLRLFYLFKYDYLYIYSKIVVYLSLLWYSIDIIWTSSDNYNLQVDHQLQYVQWHWGHDFSGEMAIGTQKGSSEQQFQIGCMLKLLQI